MNNLELVEYTQKALAEKWGYVWGTFGQILTPALLKEKLNQYPAGVGDYLSFINSNWLNKRVTDCVGLIKGYYWNGRYNAATDVSADGMYSDAVKKGSINTMPNIPGICVHKKGHIGVYIGNGQVIEAHGTKYGVIQTPLHGGTAWEDWLECPYIVYSTPVESASHSYLTKGDSGAAVVALQNKLISLGYKLNGGADGDYGDSTSAAVMAFQTSNKLVVDNEVGNATLSAINDAIAKTNKPTSGVVTATTLNVRSGAGTTYPILGTLAKDSTVKIDKKVGDWYSIYYGEHGGYVSAEYIK